MKYAVFMVMVVLCSMFVYAEDTVDAGTTPDSMFYGLDTFGEGFHLGVTFNSLKQAQLELKYADERMAEMEKMIEKNKTKYIEKLEQKRERLLLRAGEDINKSIALGKNVTELALHLTEMHAKHIAVLQRVLLKVPESARKGIENALSKSNQSKAVESVIKEKPENKTEEKPAEQPVTGDFIATIVFETNHGSIEFGVYGDTPIASQNMIDKVKAGFYNNLIFHRVAKSPDGSNFVIQGGDPQGTGMGGGQMGVDPIGNHSNLKGTIAMASSSRAQPITDQSDAQFFFNTNDNTFLDGMGFIAFGKVTAGYDVCEKIQNVPCGPGGDGSNSSPIDKVVITKAYVK